MWNTRKKEYRCGKRTVAGSTFGESHQKTRKIKEGGTPTDTSGQEVV